LYPTISLFNHSCVPNCLVLHDKGTLTVQSGPEPISASTELLLNYLGGDPELSFEMRQQELQHMYFFGCDCVKCQYEAAHA